MDHPLIEFLSRYIDLSPDLTHTLLESSLVREFPKGTVLLRQGEPVLRAYFVLKGCVRSYAIKDGAEKTIDFYLEEDAVLPIGYGREAPAEYFIVCAEDTVAMVNTVDQEEEMIRAHPELKAFCLTRVEVMAENLNENLTRLQTTNAEERYLYLRDKRADVLQRTPQYQIASYLGVQPESLSRIRKRLNKHTIGRP